jgi:hypothetical protein
MDGFKNFQQMPRSPERRFLQQNLPLAGGKHCLRRAD